MCTYEISGAGEVGSSAVEIREGSSGPIAEFWEHLRSGRFMIQRSRSKGTAVLYPRVMLPGTGETDLEWVEASGRGVVYAASVVLRSKEAGGDYSLVLVDIEEGPRMLARVEGIDPHDVRIGLPVVGRVERLREDADVDDAQPVVVFYPDAQS